MIAATFNIMSKKQNVLNEATINKLGQCLGDVKSVSQKFLGDVDQVTLALSIFKSWIPTEANHIGKSSLDKIDSLRKEFENNFNYTHTCNLI